MTNSRKRLRLSPLFVRFAQPERQHHSHSIAIFQATEGDEADGDLKVTEYYLHPRKGWRKRRVWQ